MALLSYGDHRAKTLYDQTPVGLQHLVVSVYGYRLRAKAYGRYYRRYRGRLEWTQWLDDAALERYQVEALRSFLGHAQRHAPYWRAVFRDRGFDPDGLRSPGDLRRLPVLDKQTVRQQGPALESRPDGRIEAGVVSVHTSGTTGTPLRIRLTREAWEREYAFRWQHRSWLGVHRGDRTATFAGHPVVPIAQATPPYWRYNAAERQLLFSSQHISDASAEAYVGRLRRFRPVLVHGYPSALALIAGHILDAGVRDIAPTAVVTHSETLLAEQRDRIERAFGCVVADWYGTTEHVANIVQCDRGGRHVRAEHSVVELLGTDGDPVSAGEVGEIVATGFGNRATPLIRYATGDLAVPTGDRCACGRAGPLVERIEGRVEDMVVTPEGRRVGRLDHVFKGVEHVVESQLVQRERDRIEVRIVAADGFSDQDRAALEAGLRERVGPRMALDLRFLDAIPRNAGGKFRFVVSELPGSLHQPAPDG